jgi:hypothetical protein
MHRTADVAARLATLVIIEGEQPVPVTVTERTEPEPAWTAGDADTMRELRALAAGYPAAPVRTSWLPDATDLVLPLELFGPIAPAITPQRWWTVVQGCLAAVGVFVLAWLGLH